MEHQEPIKAHQLPSLLRKSKKPVLGERMTDPKKVTRADLYREITPEQAVSLMRRQSFEEYVKKSATGNSDPSIPINMFFGLKGVAERKTDASRLLDTKQLKMLCNVTPQQLQNHLFRFENVGIITVHGQGIRSAHKRYYTYTIPSIDDWDKELINFMENWLMQRMTYE